MPIEVTILRAERVQVTAENEEQILNDEWMRRYGERTFTEGDEVEFVRDGKQKHVDHFGEDHTGKRAIVTALSEHGDVKILAISTAGEFVELWTPEAVLVAVPR